MNLKYFQNLAMGNLQKNRQFYLPYIFTQAGLLACFYIILTLNMDSRLRQVRGGEYLPTFMLLGVTVMIILSTILIIYMNRFLMRQRKHEFGLYNVLGMEKRHICRILWGETLISNGASILIGLLTGIVFYKLSSLLICRLLRVDSILGFYYIRPISIFPSIGFFAILDFLLYLFNCISIRVMKPIEMLQSKKAGEKEPKTNWLLFILGILTLGWGYYLSISCKNPLQAIDSFFGAVILVIIGTYCLFIAGSILVLRSLKARSGFYYKRNHMIAVSGLLYRMRQNAVGLASITILACGVLVMVSTTISLYAGTEESLDRNFYSQLMLSAVYKDGKGEEKQLTLGEMQQILEKIGHEHGYKLKEAHEEDYLEVTYLLEGDALKLVKPSLEDGAQLACVTFMDMEAYEESTGKTLELGTDEIAICSFNVKKAYTAEQLKIGDKSYRIRERLDLFPIPSSYNVSIVDCYGIVLPKEADLEQVYEAQHGFYEIPSEPMHRISASYSDKISRDEGIDMMDEIRQEIRTYVTEQSGNDEGETQMMISEDSIWEASENMYGMYGSLFFLGLILGLVFLFATALIIYYKQISEGVEDRERFQIMAKIGLSQQEAKKAVSGQILLVFFLPLLVSGIHLAAAFPLLEKVLRILQLGNTALFEKCTLCAYAGFAIIYTAIYKITAKIYYRIVS